MSSSLFQNGGLPGIVFGLGQHQQWIRDDVLLPRNDQNLPELASVSSKHINSIKTELGILEWITLNPNYLIRISTVETFNFSP